MPFPEKTPHVIFARIWKSRICSSSGSLLESLTLKWHLKLGRLLNTNQDLFWFLVVVLRRATWVCQSELIYLAFRLGGSPLDAPSQALLPAGLHLSSFLYGFPPHCSLFFLALSFCCLCETISLGVFLALTLGFHVIDDRQNHKCSPSHP